MAIKTKANIIQQLSTGGSRVEVERDLIKDIVDSYTHNSVVEALVLRIEALEAAVEALQTP